MIKYDTYLFQSGIFSVPTSVAIMFVAINNIHANMKGCRKATKLCK